MIRGRCPICGYSIVIKDGTLAEHAVPPFPGAPARRCSGSGREVEA